MDLGSVIRLYIAALFLLIAPAAFAGLQLVSTIAMPGVHGRLGHLALDNGHQRLFVSVSSSDLLLVLDLKTGAVTNQITDLDQPQGTLFLPPSNLLVVSNGGNGDFGFRNATTLAPGSTLAFGSNTGALHYDQATGRVFLAYGAGHDSGIAITDSSGKPLGQLPLDSQPAGFAVDAGAQRLYVNLPASHEVAMFDLADNKRMATWTLGVESGANFPMALDASGKRLFVATRDPDRLLVLDARSGRVLQSLVAPGEVGDLDYDASNRELYAAGGIGKIAVYTSAGAGRLLAADEIQSARGAGTALLDTAAGRYYLAVPAGRRSPAEIRVYAVTASGPENMP